MPISFIHDKIVIKFQIGSQTMNLLVKASSENHANNKMGCLV